MSVNTNNAGGSLYDLASRLAPDEVKVTRLDKLEKQRLARVKAEADYKNGNLSDEARWKFLSELGVDPRKAYAEDHANAERRSQAARIPGYE